MSLLLIENAEILVTMDGERREVDNGAILIRDQLIERVGDTAQIRRS